MSTNDNQETKESVTSLEKTPISRICVWYGTEKGTAEGYAKSLQHLLGFSESVEFHVRDLERYSEFMPFETVGALNIFVVATYGTGDPPDTCEKFWRALRAKQLDVKDLPYVVAGLGHSAFTNFCGFGVKLHRKIKALGGRPLLPLLKIDGADDKPEEIFNDWAVSDLASLIIQLLPASTPSVASPYPIKKQFTDAGNLLPFSLIPPTNHPKEVDLVTPHTPTYASTMGKLFARATRTFKISKVKVVGAELQTRRITYEVEIESFGAHWQFYPACTFSFAPVLNQDLTNELLSIFEYEGKSCVEQQTHLIVYDNSRDGYAPVPEYVSVASLIAEMTDWNFTPTLNWLKVNLLANNVFPSNHPFGKLLEKHNWYKANIQDCQLTIAEVLLTANRLQPIGLQLSWIMQTMPRLAFRDYTIASLVTPLEDVEGCRFQLLVTDSVVCRQSAPSASEWELPVDTVIQRHSWIRGRACSYLFALAMQGRSGLLPTPIAWHYECLLGHMPHSLFTRDHWKHGGLWVACGSGIAPFVAFMRMRREKQQENFEGGFPPTTLVFGCRSSAKSEFLEADLIQQAVRQGWVTNVLLAFSREEDQLLRAVRLTADGVLKPLCNRSKLPERPYVQHVMIAQDDIITCMLENSQAKVFVCGSTQMSEGVGKALNDIFADDEYILKLGRQGRCVQEVW